MENVSQLTSIQVCSSSHVRREKQLRFQRDQKGKLVQTFCLCLSMAVWSILAKNPCQFSQALASFIGQYILVRDNCLFCNQFVKASRLSFPVHSMTPLVHASIPHCPPGIEIWFTIFAFGIPPLRFCHSAPPFVKGQRFRAKGEESGHCILGC
jgi:hypothetical protein